MLLNGEMLIIDGKTAVYGIIGYPVKHSFSPAMQNAAMRKMGLNCIYVPFCPPSDQVGEAMAGIRALGIAGLNVTVPYKEAVIPYLDELTEDAILYGAVNTIITRKDNLIGDNTDGAGFIKALQEDHRYDPACGPALIFGAGGSARAVIIALAQSGCPELALVNRRVERAKALAEAVYDKTGITVDVFQWDAGDKYLANFAKQASLLVNCTPLGMSGGAVVDFPLTGIYPSKGQLVYDLVYNPARTAFMDRAIRNGAEAANGITMLLHQGAISFEKWTGLPAPVEIMRRELYKRAGVQ